MAAQETNLYNAFETTLTATAGSSDLTFTVNSVTAPTSITLAVPFYLVINPDSSTNREVVEITSINTGTKTLTCSGIGKRYLAGSAATSGLSHASGSTVRMSPVEQHIEDLNDRVDTIINEAGTAVNTSLFLDEDDMSTDSATKGVTQQSVKAYVDTKVTAEDLDTAGNAGTGAVDLDSQSLTVSGDGTILSSTASGQSITFAIADATTSAKGAASFATANFAVSSGAVTIKSGGVDLTDEVTGTLPVGNGGTGATTLTDGGVLLGSGTSAVTATAVLTNGQLLIGDGTGDPTVATLTGGTNVTVTNGAGSISIASTDTNTTYSAGDGLDLSTTTFSTDLKSNGGVVIESTELAVDLGASSITGTLAVDDGGSGQTSYTNGQLLIGNTTGNTLAKATLTAGSNVSITNGTGSISIAATDTNTTYTAGTLLDLATTTFNVDLSEAAEAAIVDGDYVMFLDGGATGTAAKENIADVATLFAGDGLAASSSVIGLDLNELTAAAVNVANDSIAIIDADASNGTRKESIADLATAMAGTGLSASSGQLTASGSGLTYVTGGTVSDVTGIDVDSCFTSTYRNYVLYFDGVGEDSGAEQLRLQMNASSSHDTTANSDYAGTLSYFVSSAGHGAQAAVDVAYFELIGNWIAASHFSVVIDFLAPQATDQTQIYSKVATHYLDAEQGTQYLGGVKDETTAFDGFYLYCDDTQTMTGTWKLYGYANS